MGASWAIFKMIQFMSEYVIHRRLGVYCIMSVTGLTLLVMGQFMRIVDVDTPWTQGLVPCLLWIKMLYWVWQQKFASLKKN